MEILKRFRNWLSFKTESSPSTTESQRNIEKDNDNRKHRRNSKRNGDPISEEDSVKRKCHKRDSITDYSNKIQREENKEKLNSNSVLEGTNINDETETTTVLNDYEEKTIANIHEIKEKCKEFNHRIDNFTDITGSKQFLYVDEDLQSQIEKLDKIDARDSTTIRKERKSAIKYIYLLLDRLEAIAKKNEELLKPKPFRIAPISRQQFIEEKNHLSTPSEMSNHHVPPHQSSQYLLSELNDSNSSFEDDEDSSVETSVNPSGSGEKMTKPSEEPEDNYEQLAMEKILAIKSEVEAIEQQIAEYTKEQLQEEFKKLEEILIQKTLTLDNIDSKAIETVRELRKNTIRFVQDCLKEMDSKLK